MRKSPVTSLEDTMNRRELFAVTATAAAAAMTSAAFAQEGHEGHNHGIAHKALVEAATKCVASGDICISHCLEAFAKGDTSLGACAKSVNQMLAACLALSRLGASNSSQLPQMAKVAEALCIDCEKECRKHENKHPECKACAESCKACAEECKKVAA